MDDGDDLTYDHASHYSYDIHGNVKELVQEIPQMEADGCIMAGTMNNRSKRIQYRYDLISGNVLQVDYQSQLPDQFHHRYFYDADNRIDYVETSRNAIVWREDARYFYYPHGPLARVELGGNKVQGLDYAYTLQGWLKGINSDLLTPENDMGNDALVGTINELIGRDVYGLSLGYYGQDDYAAIDDTRWLNTTALRPFAPEGGAMANTTDHQPLYNGNIAHTVNALAPFSGYPDSPTAPGQALAMVYRYDQLNRLMEARGYDGLDNTNLWANATASATDLFKSTYRYDANGNMERIERYDQHGDWYDELSYFYQHEGGKRVRNRLYHVTDSKDAANAYVNQTTDGFEDYPSQTTAAVGLDNESLVNTANNYRYDALGNLIEDKLENIENIDWTVAGKVRGVQHEDGNGDKDLLFSYGADGQRIVKEVQDDLGNFETRSYYIRDAQGNVMAHYTYDRVTGSIKVTERPMYGSSRLGVDNYTLELCGLDLNDYDPLNDPAGEQRYELTDHLGNVTTVVTDEVVGVNSDGVTGYEYFQPQVVSASGYEAFGGLLPGRNYTSESYRFGFQGQEKDDEVYGATGTSYAFEYRMHDARVGRFLSLDPLASKYPHNSPYAFSENRVIDRIELEGLETAYTMRLDQVFGNPVLAKQHAQDNARMVTGANNFMFQQAYPSNGIAQHLIDHYGSGNGADYQMSKQEMVEAYPRQDWAGGPLNLGLTETDFALVDGMTEGSGVNFSRTNVEAYSGVAGALGHTYVSITGRIMVGENGERTFQGSVNFSDDYSFEAGSHRTPGQEALTAVGRYGLMGQPFDIKGSLGVKQVAGGQMEFADPTLKSAAGSTSYEGREELQPDAKVGGADAIR